MNKVLAIVAVLVAAGAAVAFALLDSGQDTPSDSTLDPNAPSVEDPVVGLKGRATEAGIGLGESSSNDLRITGIVRSGGAGVTATVEVFRGGGVNPANPTQPDVDDKRSSMRDMLAVQLGVTWEPATASVGTASDGSFGLASLPSGFYSVWARDADGRQGYTNLIVPIEGAARHVEIDLAEAGADLAVRVLQGDTPYGGALYVIRGERGGFGGPTARADLDAEGRATFAALPGAQIRLIAFASHKSLVVSGPIDIPQEGEYVWTLSADTTKATGKVIDPDENGIGGATVVVMAGNPAAGMVIETGSTGADGTFSIDVPGQPQMIQASAAGYMNGRGGPGPDGVILIRMKPLVGVSGQVVRKGGGAVSGARVLAMSIDQNSRGPSAFAISNANGRFALTGVEPGEVMVFVLGGGVISNGLWRVQADGYNPLAFDLAADGRTDLTLEVVDAPGLEGHVYDGSGAPVAGAIVTPQMTGSLGRMGWRGGTEGVAATNERGGFAFDALIPSKTYTLTAEAANRPKGKLKDVIVEFGAPHAPVEIRLPAERWLEVTVADSAGEPVAGARIRASRPAAQGSWQGVEGQWTTNAAGVATVGPLPEGPVGVGVASDDHIDQDDPLPVPDAPPSPTPQPFAVTLETGVAITGTIEFPEGLKSVEVRITAENSGHGPGERWMHVDGSMKADGSFRVAGLPAGQYTVSARSFGPGGRLSGSVEVEAPATDVVIEIGADAPTPETSGPRTSGEAPLVVEVLAPDGTRVGDGRIRVYSKNRRSGTNISAKTTVEVNLGEDIWVRVYDLGALANKAGGGLYGPFAADAGSISIQLEPAISIAGRVMGPDGKGVRGVRVAVVPDNPKQNAWNRFRDATSSRTDEEGRFEVKGVKSGTYLADVSAPSQFVKPDRLTLEGGDTAVRIDLRRGVSPTVTVVDYDGAPVEGATLTVRELKEGDTRHHSFAQTAANGRTNADGEGVLEGLDRERNYTLSVITDPQRHPDLIGRHVADWHADDITVELDRAYVAAGVVLGPDGTPVGGVTVWHQTPGESGASGVGTAKDGRFQIGPQASPELDLWVRVGGQSRPDLGERERVRVKADAKDIELRVDPGVTLDVHVQGWVDGKPRQATLTDEETQGDQSAQQVSSGGRVQFPHLGADKTYRIWIPNAGDGKFVFENGIRGNAGRITVTPETGKSIRGRVVVPVGVDPTDVWITVHSSAVGSIQVRPGTDGAFDTQGLPDGTWTINAVHWADNNHLSTHAEVATGADDVVLELKKQDR